MPRTPRRKLDPRRPRNERERHCKLYRFAFRKMVYDILKEVYGTRNDEFETSKYFVDPDVMKKLKDAAEWFLSDMWVQVRAMANDTRGKQSEVQRSDFLKWRDMYMDMEMFESMKNQPRLCDLFSRYVDR